MDVDLGSTTDQYLDRCIYWSHRWCSRYRRTPLCIIIDSMDQAKLTLPKWLWAKMPKQMPKQLA
jgi:hypothetical protein